MKALIGVAIGLIAGYFLFRKEVPEIKEFPQPHHTETTPVIVPTPKPEAKKTRNLTEILAEAKKSKEEPITALVPVEKESGGKSTIREETIGNVVFTFIGAEEEFGK
jgi:hypothetical protein